MHETGLIHQFAHWRDAVEGTGLEEVTPRLEWIELDGAE